MAEYHDLYRARQIAQYAQLKGDLVQPDRCELCDRLAAKLHMHHDDYAKPLEIVWCCPSCHRRVHAGSWSPTLK